ncbi:hypothetical protein [Cohaesibacter haloalkalitolerans]|uniref:hypothetical protein n=1 Tax=Cohaesibacter haloalkalitolerans TaxID=1162980 RepID=UPI0013C3E4EE|nr:hypothetical protein [Cohaesibacter haloalkalitolerans]
MASDSGGNAFVSYETIGFVQLCRIENFIQVKGSRMPAVELSTAQIRKPQGRNLREEQNLDLRDMIIIYANEYLNNLYQKRRVWPLFKDPSPIGPIDTPVMVSSAKFGSRAGWG